MINSSFILHGCKRSVTQIITMISDQNNSEYHVCSCTTVYLILQFITAFKSWNKARVEIEETEDYGNLFVNATFTQERICFFPCEHKAYQFRISSKWSINLIIWHYCIYVKLEKIISIFIHILKLAQIHFSTLSLLKTFFDATQSKVSISIQLFKPWWKLFACINRTEKALRNFNETTGSVA